MDLLNEVVGANANGSYEGQLSTMAMYSILLYVLLK